MCPINSNTQYSVLSIPYLLEAGAVALHVASMHLQNLLWPAANPSAERLNRGTIHAPLSHSELPQVGSCVAGQGLTVLKEEATQLTAGILCGKKRLLWLNENDNQLINQKETLIDTSIGDRYR